MIQRQPFRFFLLLCGILTFVNLLVVNDWATVWSGPEAHLLLAGIEHADPYFLPALIQSLLTGDLTFQLFLSRTPGVLLTIAGAGVFYWLGRKIFGDRTTVLTLLVWAATFVIPNTGKWIAADSWLLFTQLLAWIATLRFLKQPLEKWRMLTFIALLLALWLHPLSTILLFGLGGWWLYRFHPDGDRLRLINPWIVMAGGSIALYILGQWQWGHPGFLLAYFSLSFPRYLLLIFLSFLPVIGFFLAGLRDTFQKFRKKEELAIITSAWLIGGLAGQSLLVFAGMGLLVAKQLMFYFQPNYPHRNIVRTGALLHLIATFCGITLLLLYSFGKFGGLGFRSALAVGATYWIFSFVSIIGLYGYNRRLVWGGALLSGILLSLLSWIQYYPLIESKRNWPQRLEVAAQTLECTSQSKLYLHQLPPSEQEKIRLYCDPLFRKLVFTEEEEQLLEFYRNDRQNAFLVPRNALGQLGEIKDSLSIHGWTDGLEELDYVLIRN